MKHLKGYKIFESSHSNMNEYYFDMVYLLQDVFDDFNVVAKTDEEIGNYETPEHKFWIIRLIDSDNPYGVSDISDISEVGDKTVKHIVAFNITPPEKEDFKKRLDEVGDRFVSQTGMRYKIDEEEVDGYFFDYVIKIQNPPGVDNI